MCQIRRTVGQSTSFRAAPTAPRSAACRHSFQAGRPHHRLHIGACDSADRRRRRSGSARPPEHTWRPPRRRRRTGTARSPPNRVRQSVQSASMRRTSAARLRREFARLHGTPHVHRAMSAQRHEAGMHLRRNRAGVRARLGIRRPQPAPAEIFRRDIRGSPATPRHARRRRLSTGTLPVPEIAPTRSLKSVASSEITSSVEGDAGDLHGDPRPERPGRIVLVADHQSEAPWRRLSCYRLPASKRRGRSCKQSPSSSWRYGRGPGNSSDDRPVNQ